MSDNVEVVREQLARERLERDERELTRSLTARGTPYEDAERLAREHRDRFTYGDDGKPKVRLSTGALVSGDVGIAYLATEIRLKAPAPDEATRARIISQKRATGDYAA